MTVDFIKSLEEKHICVIDLVEKQDIINIFLSFEENSKGLPPLQLDYFTIQAMLNLVPRVLQKYIDVDSPDISNNLVHLELLEIWLKYHLINLKNNNSTFTIQEIIEILENHFSSIDEVVELMKSFKYKD